MNKAIIARIIVIIAVSNQYYDNYSLLGCLNEKEYVTFFESAVNQEHQ